MKVGRWWNGATHQSYSKNHSPPKSSKRSAHKYILRSWNKSWKPHWSLFQNWPHALEKISFTENRYISISKAFFEYVELSELADFEKSMFVKCKKGLRTSVLKDWAMAIHPMKKLPSQCVVFAILAEYKKKVILIRKWINLCFKHKDRLGIRHVHLKD